MLDGPPVSRVMLFSVPLIFGNIFQQLYYITDAVVVGSFLGIDALAAVNSCSWITWLLNAIARDFSNTLSILASYCIGENDQKKLKTIVGNACTITAGMSLALTLGVLGNLNGLLAVFQVKQEIVSITRDYFSTVMLGVPFVLVYHMASSLLRAAGNSRVTGYAVTASTVVNVVLDLVFIVKLGWGVKGAAAATVIAQAMEMLMVLAPFLKNPLFSVSRADWRPDRELMRQMRELWLPMFINSAVISVGGSFVSSQVNAIGPFFTAGISSATKLFTLLESIIMAIQTGLSVFMGQNLGAGYTKRVKTGVRQLVLVSLMLAAGLNGIIQLTAPWLVRIFLSSGDPVLYEQTLHVAVADIRVITLGMFLMAPMYLYRTAIQTMGYPGYPMAAGFFQLAARVFSVTVLPSLIGEYGYYIATPLAWAVTLPVVVVPYLRKIADVQETKVQENTLC